jgi:hypothetical protein
MKQFKAESIPAKGHTEIAASHGRRFSCITVGGRNEDRRDRRFGLRSYSHGEMLAIFRSSATSSGEANRIPLAMCRSA